MMSEYDPHIIEKKWPSSAKATEGKLGYNPQAIEKKWQKIWEDSGLYRADDKSDKPKYYCLDMFPYPSGSGLHVGHWRGYVLSDVMARYQMLCGKNVLHPMGYDAFGLPAENAAIKANSHPKKFTDEAIVNFRRQIKQIGTAIDWSREINTSDPEYYRWTQWLFLKLYENGLAYRQKAPVNWCPSCQTVLANEQVISGECERCNTKVIKKNLTQWFFKITDFAEELLKDLDDLEWPVRTKQLQRNWIGKSVGAMVKFEIHDLSEEIEVFTTRADTLYGATFIVLAPEHELVSKIMTDDNKKKVNEYIEETRQKSTIDRESTKKEKTGVFTGVYAINPVNNEKIPIWIADYVLMEYGTGACMCVPAHDQRDFEFAKKYKIIIRPVIRKADDFAYSYLMGSKDITNKELEKLDIEILGEDDNKDRKLKVPKKSIIKYEKLINIKLTSGFWNEYIGDDVVFIFKHKDGKIEKYILNEENESQINKLASEFCEEPLGDKTVWEWLIDNKFYTDKIIHPNYGILFNSGEFAGLDSVNAAKKIIEKLKAQNLAEFSTNYRLHDWLISRQRYWGAPIPIIYCEKCGEVPVPAKDLPVKLPENVEFKPQGDSPLKSSKDFLNTVCPKCGGKATRETDTMDTFVDSSWYYLRYCDPNNDQEFGGKDKINHWMPIDTYVGGIEHAVLHLLYARFISKALTKIGAVSYNQNGEPIASLFNIGMIYLHGAKMSKSKGNVVSPNELIEKFGTDALRGYELFIGPAEFDSEWQIQGISGVRRFLDKVWEIFEDSLFDSDELDSEIEKIIPIITKEIESIHPNTAISHFMTLFNYLKQKKQLSRLNAEKVAILLAPFFPHLAEELWQKLGKKDSIFKSSWPSIDIELVHEINVSIPIQVDGKIKDIFEIDKNWLPDEVKKMALKRIKIHSVLENKKIKKIVYVAGKIINFVVE